MRITSITRQSGLFASLLLLLIVVATHLRMVVVSDVATPWWSVVLSIAGAMVTGVIVGRTAMRSGMFRNFCTLSIPMFGIVACGICLVPQSLVAMGAALCVAAGMLLFVGSFENVADNNPIFFGSILFGIAPLLYAPCILFLALLPILALLSFHSARKIVISVVGWILPTLTACYADWYLGREFLGRIYDIADVFCRTSAATVSGEGGAEYGIFAALSCEASWSGFPVVGVAIAACVAVLGVVGIILLQTNRRVVLVKKRNFVQMTGAMALISLAAFALPRCGAAMLVVAAVPFAIAASVTLNKMRGEPATLLYWLLLLLTALHLFID